MEFKRNLIGGQWCEAAAGRRLANVNPAGTGEVVHEFPDSDPADVRRAIDAAAAAGEQWAAMKSQQRGAMLLRAAEGLADRQEAASVLLAREMGKPIGEARGEIARSVDLLRYYAGWGWRLTGTYFPTDATDSTLFTVRAPLGVVSLITPWNFPSAIPVWKLAPALVTGNTVVLKPASLAPGSAIVAAECLHEAPLPAGVLNLVCGRGGALSEALVADERVKAVSFTGSCSTGQAIFKIAASPHRRVGLEMGGKNPLLVMADADLDGAVELAVAGAMWSAGQKCTATSRAIVQEEVLDEFTRKLVARVAALRVGDPLDEANDIGPVADEQQLSSILGYIDAGLREGATLATGGRRLEGEAYDKGFYLSPAIFTDVRPQMRIAQEEIFGPVLAVMCASSFEEAMEIANGTAYGLSAAVCTRDMTIAQEFIRRIEAGLVHVNSTTTGAEVHVPFGGMKASSSGFREMGESGVDFFTKVKTVYYHHEGRGDRDR